MKNINEINLNEVVSKLEEIYKVEDLNVDFWEDEDCRNLGISIMYVSIADTIGELIDETRKLIKKDGYSSAEIRDDEYKVIYFVDDEDEKIVDLDILSNRKL